MVEASEARQTERPNNSEEDVGQEHSGESEEDSQADYLNNNMDTDIDSNNDEEEISSRLRGAKARVAVGAMGTRAKQCADQAQISLDFSYGVIDKCILRALRGEDTLIVTGSSMVTRIHMRIAEYCLESGNTIRVVDNLPAIGPLEDG
jgi:hypothetical protein